MNLHAPEFSRFNPGDLVMIMTTQYYETGVPVDFGSAGVIEEAFTGWTEHYTVRVGNHVLKSVFVHQLLAWPADEYPK